MAGGSGHSLSAAARAAAFRPIAAVNAASIASSCSARRSSFQFSRCSGAEAIDGAAAVAMATAGANARKLRRKPLRAIGAGDKGAGPETVPAENRFDVLRGSILFSALGGNIGRASVMVGVLSVAAFLGPWVTGIGPAAGS